MTEIRTLTPGADFLNQLLDHGEKCNDELRKLIQNQTEDDAEINIKEVSEQVKNISKAFARTIPFNNAILLWGDMAKTQEGWGNGDKLHKSYHLLAQQLQEAHASVSQGIKDNESYQKSYQLVFSLIYQADSSFLAQK